MHRQASHDDGPSRMLHDPAQSVPANDPALFKALIKPPRIAWPTLALLLIVYAIFAVSTLAYVRELPLQLLILFNAFAC
jgi:hypothetical protein